MRRVLVRYVRGRMQSLLRVALDKGLGRICAAATPISMRTRAETLLELAESHLEWRQILT